MDTLQLGLILLDEVHLLNEAGRGSSLESGCVGRIKAVARMPELVEVGKPCCNVAQVANGFEQLPHCGSMLASGLGMSFQGAQVVASRQRW